MNMCPKCGRESKGVCLECFLEAHPLEAGEVKVLSCACGRLRHRDRWDARLEDIGKYVEKGLKAPFEVTLKSVRVAPVLEGSNLALDIAVEGVYKGEPFKRTITGAAKVQKTTCPTCSRKSGGYFEAVLQFRCPLPELPLDERQIAKVEKSDGGLDYYLLSNNYARGYASQLSRKGYAVKSSNKAFSMRDGQSVYRIYYSIKKV
ncbi:MAG: NMD3-related protein [Candidatus Altiarchaeota archaeon]|nr:NMD3-related protein [Candidatus Altiarchaeota archaeon]